MCGKCRGIVERKRLGLHVQKGIRRKQKKKGERERGEKKALGLSGADLRSLPLDCCSPLLLLSHTSAKAERERKKENNNPALTLVSPLFLSLL